MRLLGLLRLSDLNVAHFVDEGGQDEKGLRCGDVGELGLRPATTVHNSPWQRRDQRFSSS